MRWPHRITIVHPPLVDGQLDEQVKDWDAATRRRAWGEVQQESSTEVINGREAQVTTTVLFLEGCETVEAIDRVECHDGTFEVSGQPAVRRDGRGRIDHTRVVLRKVAG